MLVTTQTFRKKKEAGEKIALLTAYDYPTAMLMDESGVDAVLVGDSLGMAVMGMENTLNVTMDMMVHHVKMVRAGLSRAMLIADMPYLSYQINTAEAIRNAGRLIAEGGAQAVKLEGSARFFGEAIAGLGRAGIPVMGHLGLTPQFINQLGGYKIQGRTEEQARQLQTEALELQKAGCFALVLECVPAELAMQISNNLSIPTIGIGAGNGCDGQVLVWYDMAGWGRTKFTKNFKDVRSLMLDAFTAYVEEVRRGEFPGKEHSFE
ncbi:MAG TPA: 3-methyl-2-oxobutanoate hydroxymethyltransferase [Candidatus Hydrogenedentes bacterium]|jgi:3-methyl-2-oxobutanoate hydroxymethyltransferase|nr:MAG: 3-methyl-2-oxobutanoate hydroxymethyltransferase [Candidatus Hydrogenedentes bacterium ADurb.Bin170]HNZ47665.1 3-methyl-2-oxobutanoate hydroxymethyltransferase [Candidatus Hydrogenedentota bacterium]HOD95493.1 3-methyl-2-oxobutanoate hydroxymethyltransferase [Candidatus Hydrogenedentota bacterium]HOM47490.1 3-methyl-2-oxobutanoate hydroxymethyltransferase [Candidatus Hydrogenedentota bacterium]HOR50948.1 3-methyl-2-oxobutanoate hydroxymethyltransferase [Candidatus Hydrogenedentota bacte